MALSSIMDPILNPVLGLHPFFAIMLMSFVIALAMTLVYKWVTNQQLMKQLKEDIKKYQKEMKEHRTDTKKVMEIQKKAMDVNMKYMSHSMKPTLISFIPIILIFGWMQGHLAYEPIMPGQEFQASAIFNTGISGNATLTAPEGFKIDNNMQEIINGQANWTLTAPALSNKEGDEYILEFEKNGESIGKDIIITYKQQYKTCK